MKTAYFIAILFATLPLLAQKKEFPDFGKIDKSDLEMKECDFDKDAAAYKLLDIGEVIYERSGKNFFRMRTSCRTRIKILKDKGFEEANIKLRFYSKQGYETIRDISANTYNLDEAGNIVTIKLDKASIFTKKIDNRISEVVFTMPQIKVGSVIEFRNEDIKESYQNIEDWYFQSHIPTRYSQYMLRIPSMFKFVTEKLTVQPVEEKSGETEERIGTADATYRYTSFERSFIMRKIPALRGEPYMGSFEDYLQRIQFQLYQIDNGDGSVTNLRSSWPKLTEQLLEDEDFGLQLKKNIPKTQELENQLKGITDNYKKMAVIHDYVRRNMNGIGIPAIYAMDGVKTAWDKKSGTNTEVNKVLIDLLKNAGLEAYPLLVSTRGHGSVNTLYPFLQQFNEVMAYVKIGDKSYVLNAADKYNPPQLTPSDVLNTQGFIVDKEHGGWVSMDNNKQRFSNVVSLFADITNDGIMDGEALVKSGDYAKNPRVQRWKEDRTNFKNYFVSENNSMKVDSIELDNVDDDTLELEQKIKFKSQLSSAGDYKYFTINLFNGLDKNPFIADERHTDIEFGYKQFYGVYGTITIPDGYKIEELPKNLVMITPDTGIILRRLLQTDASGLHIKLTVDFTKPVYLAGDYADFKEFYKKLYATLNEQIVLKKTPK